MSDLELPADDDALLALAFSPSEIAPLAGLFADDAPIRRLSRENAVLMGGGCALLLEVAHPLVAAGVARHSAFQREPFARLKRTLEAMSAIVFGTSRQAVEAVRKIERAHRSVHGQLGQRAGSFEADARYSARAGELVLWVWATLAWTTVRVHERLLDPIAGPDLEAFHADQARVARLLGVPASRVPATRDAFRDYVDSMVRDRLFVTGEARAVSDALFTGPAGTGVLVGGLPGAGMARALATSLLPPDLRDPFGLPWSPEEEARLDRFAESVRSLRRR